MRTCGRLTKRAGVCRQPVLAYWGIPDSVPRALSCLAHLTSEERAVYDKAIQERTARTAAAWKWFFEQEPACWRWPAVGVIAADEAEQSQILYEWQAGRCAVCGRLAHLLEDHEHATGLTRGYLCTSCNTREGIYSAQQDGPFAKYRDRHPTLILGMRIRYWDPIAKDYARPRPALADADAWVDAASDDIGL
jgi:hypothetical protein